MRRIWILFYFVHKFSEIALIIYVYENVLYSSNGTCLEFIFLNEVLLKGYFCTTMPRYLERIFRVTEAKFKSKFMRSRIENFLQVLITSKIEYQLKNLNLLYMNNIYILCKINWIKSVFLSILNKWFLILTYLYFISHNFQI